MEPDGFGVGPDARAFFVGDVLDDFVEDFRHDERALGAIEGIVICFMLV